MSVERMAGEMVSMSVDWRVALLVVPLAARMGGTMVAMLVDH